MDEICWSLWGWALIFFLLIKICSVFASDYFLGRDFLREKWFLTKRNKKVDLISFVHFIWKSSFGNIMEMFLHNAIWYPRFTRQYHKQCTTILNHKVKSSKSNLKNVTDWLLQPLAELKLICAYLVIFHNVVKLETKWKNKWVRGFCY